MQQSPVQMFTGHENSVAQPKADKRLSSTSHFSLFNNVLGLFCSLTKGITPKICMFCFVLINSILLNLLCVDLVLKC